MTTDYRRFTDSMGIARMGYVLAVSPTHVKVEVTIDRHHWVDWIPVQRFTDIQGCLTPTVGRR